MCSGDLHRSSVLLRRNLFVTSFSFVPCLRSQHCVTKLQTLLLVKGIWGFLGSGSYGVFLPWVNFEGVF